jgi:hypothetical protein
MTVGCSARSSSAITGLRWRQECGGRFDANRRLNDMTETVSPGGGPNST